jgi:hypothetical protein
MFNVYRPRSKSGKSRSKNRSKSRSKRIKNSRSKSLKRSRSKSLKRSLKKGTRKNFKKSPLKSLKKLSQKNSPRIASPLCTQYLMRRKNLMPFKLPEYKQALDACATPVQMCQNELRLNRLKGLNTLSRECLDILKYNKLIEMERNRAFAKAETKNLNMQRGMAQMTGDYTRYNQALERALPSPPKRK